MITYKHEAYIGEAIAGVLIQETSFDYELIIADDNSPDNTSAIVDSFKNHKNYFRIQYFKHSINKGMQSNFSWAYAQCKGKYIALCEGDDYWTDPLKLQKQVDFLEKNADFALCFHKARVKYEGNIEPFYPNINSKTNEVTTLDDIIKGNYIHTPTVVFRKNILVLPQWFESVYPGDWPLHILNAIYGKIKFFTDEMAVYRVHLGGVHSGASTSVTAIKGMSLNKFLGEELIFRGFPEIGRKFLRDYSASIAYIYGLNAFEDKTLSRFSMFYNLLLFGSWKMKLLCFLPLFFGCMTNRVYTSISRYTKLFLRL